jgi:hypothetical protein
VKLWGTVAVAALGVLASTASTRAAEVPDGKAYKFQVAISSAEYGGHQFQIGDLNNKGQFNLNVVGAEKDTGDGGEVHYFWDGKAVVRVQPSSTKLSDGSSLISSSMWTPMGINDLGHVAYVADTDNSPHAIVIWDSNTKSYTMVANNQSVVDGGTLTSAGVALEGRMVADINNVDQVVWSEGLTPASGGDANDAVFMYDPTTKKITTVARAGTTLPGGKTVVNALFPNINDAGEVVFMANTTDNENYGVYQSAGGNITVICAPGTKVGDLTIEQAKLPRNSDGGHVVFRGETTSNGTAVPAADDTGFFIYSAGKITKIVAPGDALPGGKFVATEGNRRAMAVNKNGLVAFKATMEGDAAGIFLWQDGQFSPLITTGQKLEGSITVEGLVQGLGGQDGYHLGINDFGDVAFSAFGQDTHVGVLASAPRP